MLQIYENIPFRVQPEWTSKSSRSTANDLQIQTRSKSMTVTPQRFLDILRWNGRQSIKCKAQSSEFPLGWNMFLRHTLSSWTKSQQEVPGLNADLFESHNLIVKVRCLNKNMLCEGLRVKGTAQRMCRCCYWTKQNSQSMSMKAITWDSAFKYLIERMVPAKLIYFVSEWLFNSGNHYSSG